MSSGAPLLAFRGAETVGVGWNKTAFNLLRTVETDDEQRRCVELSVRGISFLPSLMKILPFAQKFRVNLSIVISESCFSWLILSKDSSPLPKKICQKFPLGQKLDKNLIFKKLELAVIPSTYLLTQTVNITIGLIESAVFPKSCSLTKFIHN